MSTIRRSSSSYGSFGDGIVIRGMPLLTLYPGNVYWVDSNGGGGSKGTFAHPVATLAEAEALLTTDNGDIICIKPGHAETLTATVDFDLSGFAIVGLGFGDNRPTFTNGTTENDDVFDSPVMILLCITLSVKKLHQIQVGIVYGLMLVVISFILKTATLNLARICCLSLLTIPQTRPT